MSSSAQVARRRARSEVLLVAVVLVCGVALRVREAAFGYLSPDEAMHVALAVPEDWSERLASALLSSHPPLLIFAQHWVNGLGPAEWALRLIPLTCGSLVPLLVYLWLRRSWGTTAAVAGLVLTAFSPRLISLSAEIRSYSTALLALSISLWLLERGLQRRSAAHLAAASCAMFLAVAADFSSVFLVLGAGFYFLIRARQLALAPGLYVAWSVGQGAALALLVWLHRAQVVDFTSSSARDDATGQWLRGAFLQHGDNPAVFAVSASVKQFAYFFASVPAGVVAATVASAALLLLLLGKPARNRDASLAWFVLLFSPLLANLLAAMVQVFPFGRSRHTAYCGIVIAALLGIAAQHWIRRRQAALAATALLLVPVWLVSASEDPLQVPRALRHKRHVQRLLDEVRPLMTPGSLFLLDAQSGWLLFHYLDLGPRPRGDERQLQLLRRDGCDIAVLDWRPKDRDYFTSAWRELERTVGTERAATAWIIDGGFPTAYPGTLRTGFRHLAVDERLAVGPFRLFRLPEGLPEASPAEAP